MHPLLYATLGLFLMGVGVAAYAMVFAREGYEDDEGFHGIESAKQTKPDGIKSADTSDDGGPPPLVAH